uniref:GLI pathogenesis-related 2 n=1 Tax=Sinocyclocheilus rhinocerous TaxID=307959 RepID=A0A673KCY7_9TELE
WSMSDSSFEAKFLQTHNAYRKQHGAPPLTINKNLCRSSQEWAEYLLSIRTLMHSSGEYGENVYYAWSSASKRLTGREAVESWYSEIKDYNFSRPGFTSKTGHFTQVVWKDTKEVGVGLATDGNTTFVVGQYLPAGNISNAGYFERNVLPAGSKADFKSTPSGESGMTMCSSFEAEFLQSHNVYRRQHGAPPLTINKNLCRSAQAWAEHLLSITTLKHSNKDYGENLYYAWSSATKKLTGHEAVENWYSEIKDFNFGRPGFSSKTGHFTQVVWKDTKEVGVGLATDGNTTFVVGQYLPAGNITNAGYFEKNVLPAGTKVDSRSTGTSDMGCALCTSNNSLCLSVADSSFEAKFLQTHNAYRKQHGAPPLTINKNLCRSSQEWAEYLLSIRTLMHSSGEYGENVYYAWSSASKRLTGREAVESWYSEIKDYNFSRPGFTSKTGHFTQVVWKDTKEVGVGLATDGNTTFVVGQYLPAGNISNAGYFERNVLPAGSKADFKSTPSGESGMTMCAWI